MSFGGFPFVGVSNTSLNGLMIADMQKLPVTSHSTDQYWPLIKDVIGNATYKRMYIAHMRTIVNEIFVSKYYQTKAAQLMSLIDTAVMSDTNKFFTYAQYQSSMTASTPNGSFPVPGISTLVEGRVTYLQSTADFTNTPPVITAVKPSDTIPALYAKVAITANVTNTTTSGVYLGYRFANSDKFNRIQMMDDGLNNDGLSGDNIYGANLTMSGNQMQYYIYAENANAGMFSPERAEHEFYTLKSGTPVADAGQVAINEFLASNKTVKMDEKGEYEDWIELYNITASPLNLGGLFLSDSYANPKKYTFPANTIIPAHGYLVLWADENASTTSYLHCNFKLSTGGEQLLLTNETGKVLDSLSFGTQLDDISLARCPNGTGKFKASIPTFNASNCPDAIGEYTSEPPPLIYPNPANETVTIEFTNSNSRNQVIIYNAVGQQVGALQSTKKAEQLIISNLPAGLYFIRVNGNQLQKMEITR
jgi:hypothetical protein